jgi:hypothetical protein
MTAPSPGGATAKTNRPVGGSILDDRVTATIVIGRRHWWTHRWRELFVVAVAGAPYAECPVTEFWWSNHYTTPLVQPSLSSLPTSTVSYLDRSNLCPVAMEQQL